MSFGENVGNNLLADCDENKHRQDARVDSERGKAASHPASNWAWATAQRNYDWMDLHVPFASLD